MLLGAQMYTVRDFTKDLTSFSETLKKIANIGYTDVQVSGTCRFDAEWLAAELKKNGLTCSITHTAQNRVLDETAAVIDEHKTFGCKYIGIGSLPGSVENYFDFRDEIMAAAKKIKAAGLQMMLHNHHREFERSGPERMTFLDRVTQDFSNGELGITLDVFWAQYAGADPAACIEKLSGHVPCVHLKDMQVIGGKQLMASVGSGNMNFPAILKACEGSGVEHLLVEQDDCNGIDPFTCLKRSYQYLTSLGLR